MELTGAPLVVSSSIWPFSRHDKRISYFPMFPHLNAVGMAPHSSSGHGLSHLCDLAFSFCVNLGSLARAAKFKSPSSAPSLHSGRSDAFFIPPSSSGISTTCRRRWNRSKAFSQHHCPSVDLAFQFRHFAVPPLQLPSYPVSTTSPLIRGQQGPSLLICSFDTITFPSSQNTAQLSLLICVLESPSICPRLTSLRGYLSALLFYLSAILLAYPAYLLSLLLLVYTSCDIYTNATAIGK